ncbi:MAG: flagellar basal body rod protein FlgB [Clostridia bacterium]
MFGWFVKNTGILEKSLDAVWLRNQVISNNIANVDTPGFKSSKVEFENILRSAMENGELSSDGTAGMDGLEPVVVENRWTTMRMDGNNVDIDSEMVDLARNSIRYDALVQKISKEFGRIRMAIREGK